jgi:hypothetical protein
MAGSAVWTTPMDWVNGITVLDSHLNPQVRDNLTWLKAALAGTSGITGQVSTAALAVNAVTQVGSASASGAVTTTSGTFVDLDAMSVTLTTRGGRCLVLFSARTTRGGGSDAGGVFDARIDSSNAGWWAGAGFGLSESQFTGWVLFTSIEAGSHTFKIQWKATANTPQCNFRAMTVIEFAR